MLVASIARPAQPELAVTGQAESAICDQLIELDFAWMARFRRFARDHERLVVTLAGLHFVAFAILQAHRFLTVVVQQIKSH